MICEGYDVALTWDTLLSESGLSPYGNVHAIQMMFAICRITVPFTVVYAYPTLRSLMGTSSICPCGPPDDGLNSQHVMSTIYSSECIVPQFTFQAKPSRAVERFLNCGSGGQCLFCKRVYVSF